MADSSSDSDTHLHHFRRQRGPQRGATKGRSGMHNADDVSEKIDALASTLQETSRDLTNVDRMLGRYRGYTNEQMETVAQLRDDLEQSIDELRSQRLSRQAGRSIPSLRTSDLQDNSATNSRLYRTTSPLRDPGEYRGTDRRRSRSATVRFVDDLEPLNHVHTLHRSVRDLRSDQFRLGEEFDEEVAKRNRTDSETRKAVNSISEKLRDMSRTETVSERVERRLQEIEKEMRTERHLAERREDQLGHMAVQLKEELRKRNGKINEMEEMKNKLSRSEGEKSLIEQELDRTRRKLEQSEGSRETLACQIDDLRSQLLKTEQERATLQHRISESQQRRYRGVEEDGRLNQRVAGISEHEKQLLEKQILELRAQLNCNTVLSEVEELKRSLERKDKEKSQLSAHIEVLNSDLEKREKQQLRMLNQLQEIQSRYDDCMQDHKSAGLEIVDLARQLKESSMEADRCRAQLKEVEHLRLESEKKKDELKIKAQESIRQWKIKCKKLERDLEKQKENISHWMEQHNQVELADDKSFAKAQRRQVEKVKTECNKLTEELIQGEAENSKLRRKYHLLKQELEEKGKLAVNGEESVRQLEQMTFQLNDQIRRIQTEQETILCSVGKEIDAACDFLSRDPGDKFKAITLTHGLENDPHRWLAEVKTKLQWLCEEMKEREGRELKLRSHLRQCRVQLKELLQDKESESQLFIEQIAKQERLLEEIHKEKRELLQKMCQKDEEMRALQVRYDDRIADLESSTRMALDHLESVPERLSILDGIRDLEDSQRHREMIEERYSKYKEIVTSLQQQLRDSTRKIRKYQEEESDTILRRERLESLPVALYNQNDSPPSCSTPKTGSPDDSSRRRNLPFRKEDASQGQELSRAANGRKSPAEKDKY
ncbi:centrosomal protein of 128 kDa isoform X5 [Chiloscyllium plagiosum]|uniref:centrosomal protein of 128 kDa isoform X5 n=1 Tax=Chiloscyllium plagiosum TaxID=36176 RepID=UPI001CB837D1|nr:centrosomal protein of 128 kDa isoform X5 [Chiloscyllium plagiosum]